MITLATASADSPALPAAFFERWTDHATWTSWDTDTEWVTLDGPVAVGTRGVLKPKGGPKAKFFISALEQDRVYTDTSLFPGARLVFEHTAERRGDSTHLEVTVTMTGPLARLWAGILRTGFAKSVPAGLERLVAIVEGAHSVR
jgi:hypothetical protein